jgi:hypothetical protein
LILKNGAIVLAPKLLGWTAPSRRSPNLAATHLVAGAAPAECLKQRGSE